MIQRINFVKIINDHLRSLRSLNDSKKRLYWGDAMLFFVLPIILSAVLVMNDISIKKLIGELVKAIAIFAAFLFNMLAIIYNSMNQLEKDSETSGIKKIYIKEIHSNISFNILVGIILIIVLLVFYTIEPKTDVLSKINDLFSGISYFLLMLFFLTLLLNLNRVYILLNRHIRDKISN